MKKIKEWKSERLNNEFIELEKAQREKIVVAINNAKIKHRWSYVPTEKFYAQNQWNQTLIQKIFSVSDEFGGNGLICSCEISAILMDSSVFFPDSTPMTSSSFNFLGMLGSLSLFLDTYMPAIILIIIKSDFFTSSNPECAIIYVDNLISF